VRALITGGGGFAASHLAEHLLERRCDVTLVARLGEHLHSAGHLLSQARLERADLRDFARLREVLRETRPERLYHLAAFSSVVDSFRNPRECYETNFGGTLNLLEAWRELRFDSRMLFVSSSQVYGQPGEAEMPLRETSPLRPESPYAGSKIAAEFLAIQFGSSYGLPVVRARPFNHTGPRQSPAFVCSDLARQVVEIECGLRPPILTVGSAETARDFSDVRDIVRGYVLLLERGRPGEAYQLCSGRAVSVRAIIERLVATASVPIDVRVDATKAHAAEARILWGDAAKARSEVGWEPRYDLETSLGDLKTYWRKQIDEEVASSRPLAGVSSKPPHQAS
jgi:GDP-4-dehydro-6-deoxy-D-mannose reductase